VSWDDLFFAQLGEFDMDIGLCVIRNRVGQFRLHLLYLC
jgi:hypothetical protein